MPRVPSDKTITHRIELGLPERQKLDEILEAYKQNNAIDGVTATLQAAGSALAGGGMIWAAAALAAYLAPGLLKKAYNDTKDLADKLVAPIVDPLVTDLQKELYEPIIEANKKVKDAQYRVDQFCSPGVNYNAQQCTIAQNDLAAAEEERKQAKDNAMNFPDNTKNSFEKLWDLAVPGGVFNPFD